MEAPATGAEAAEALHGAARSGGRVRVVGGGTKQGWGRPTPEPDMELSTAALDRVVEHNEGDFTAVLEPGVPLARAQEAFVAAGQMLALDPPLGENGAATVGGVIATADSGPLRHRYGAPRDLVLGVTVALPDGRMAKAGGRVIKNVAGYDLGRLMAGAFGTLGAIVQVAVRLHPLPQRTATAIAAADDPGRLAAAASDLAHASLELESLDVRWSDGRGAVLARSAGAAPLEQAEAALGVAGRARLAAEIAEDDDPLWDLQREGQRSAAGVVVRVSALQTQLAEAARLADALGASLVGRAGAGVLYLRLEGLGPDEARGAVEHVRRALEPAPCVVLDAPVEVRRLVDPWGVGEGPELTLMRRLKAQFDPTGACNPGLYVGGI